MLPGAYTLYEMGHISMFTCYKTIMCKVPHSIKLVQHNIHLKFHLFSFIQRVLKNVITHAFGIFLLVPFDLPLPTSSRHLEENLDDWLTEELDNYLDDDYLVFDCPGTCEFI